MTRHTPRKRFGQHFLHDVVVIENIIQALGAKPLEHWVEIGPGAGALTLPLLEKVQYLDAIELDRDLAAKLAHIPRLHLYSADVLNVNFTHLQKDERLLRLCGNLPYNISTPLIFHLLAFTSIIQDMVFMLQKEVALRMAAKKNDADYGRLSIMVQYHCHVEILFHVAPQAFHPPPKVDSSIVRLVPHRPKPYPAQDELLFSTLVKDAFNQRRKTLRNSLKKWLNDAAWDSISLPSHLRPEELSVENFVSLSNALKVHT